MASGKHDFSKIGTEYTGESHKKSYANIITSSEFENFQDKSVCQEHMSDKLLVEAAPHGLKIFAKNLQEPTSELVTDKFVKKTKGWNSTKTYLINDAANFAFQKNNKDSDSQMNSYAIENPKNVSLIAATDAMYPSKGKASSYIHTESDFKVTPESPSTPLSLTRSDKISSSLFTDFPESVDLARSQFEPNTRQNEMDHFNQSLENHNLSRGAAQIAHAETFSMISKAQQQKSHRNQQNSSWNPSRRHTFVPQNFNYNEKYSLPWHPYHQFRVHNSEHNSQEQCGGDMRPFRKHKDDKLNNKTSKSAKSDENVSDPSNYDQEILVATAKRNASLSLHRIDEQISAKDGKTLSNISEGLEPNKRALTLEKNDFFKNIYPECDLKGKKTKISSAKDGASRLISRVASKRAKNMGNSMDKEKISQEKELKYNSGDCEKNTRKISEDTKISPSTSKDILSVPLDISSRVGMLSNKIIKPRKYSILPVKVPTTLDNTIEDLAETLPIEQAYPRLSEVNQEFKQEKKNLVWHKPKDWHKMIRGHKLEESVTKNSDNIAMVNETSVSSRKSRQRSLSDEQIFFDALEHVETSLGRLCNNDEEESDSSSEGLIFYDAL